MHNAHTPPPFAEETSELRAELNAVREREQAHIKEAEALRRENAVLEQASRELQAQHKQAVDELARLRTASLERRNQLAVDFVTTPTPTKRHSGREVAELKEKLRVCTDVAAALEAQKVELVCPRAPSSPPSPPPHSSSSTSTQRTQGPPPQRSVLHRSSACATAWSRLAKSASRCSQTRDTMRHTATAVQRNAVHASRSPVKSPPPHPIHN